MENILYELIKTTRGRRFKRIPGRFSKGDNGAVSKRIQRRLLKGNLNLISRVISGEKSHVSMSFH